MGAGSLRLRIERVGLVGTSRSIDFESGLNVVLGDTTTGKTSLMRLLRVLLGSDYDGIIPELRRVSDLSGRFLIGEEQISVVRRLTQTDNAPVDVAAGEFAARLPAMRSDHADLQTYGDWLIDRLELPHLRIPTAPSRPSEAATTPVSIADYLRYCRLTQKQIDIDVLGSSNFFTDYKRRVAFRIYFGTYDVRVADLQETLRSVEGELRSLKSGNSAFDEFLEGTELANRAKVEAELDRAKGELAETSKRRGEFPEEAQQIPAVVEATRTLREIDRLSADLQGRRENELVGERQMAELAKQLRAQSVRLTKAVVAGSHLVDFDFRLCPRCGHEVGTERAEESHCYLCLQVPSEEMSREDLLVEQVRIEAQIDEAEELQEQHAQAVGEIDRQITEVQAQRVAAASKLDQLTQGFVSDRADEIAQFAARQSRAEAEIDRYEEYLGLLEKADAARVRAEQLQGERSRIEEELRRAERTDHEAQARIEHLEGRLANFVEALQMPRFEDDSELRAAINRGSYEPIVNGRPVDRHSGGMALLINIAYMLALHQTGLDLDLKIPQLLMIDGITKNLGRGEYDNARYRLIWSQLADLHEKYAEQLQIVVATNDLPDFIEDLDVVRVRLTAQDRLVPSSEVEVANSHGSHSVEEPDDS